MAVTNISSQKTIQQIINENAAKTSPRNTGSLGKDDFINLLVTQLRYQDPLNPTDDKEFIGQMAQFSALEQMTNLNDSFSASKAFSLIGKNITANITDDTTQEQTQITGNVANVKMSDGKILLVVNGKDIPVESVANVSDSSLNSSTSIAEYTNLIGANVDGIAYDPDTSDMISVSGTVKAIQKGVYEDYAVLDGVNAQIGGLVTDTQSADPDFIKNALQDAYDQGKQISVYVVDSNTGKKVPVTGTISKLDFTGGKTTAVLNGVAIPVEGVTEVTKPAQTTTAAAAGQDQTQTQAGGTNGG